jgi:hypothetical protein
MSSHLSMLKYTWIPAYGKTHNQIGDVLIHKRWHSNIADMGILRDISACLFQGSRAQVD